MNEHETTDLLERAGAGLDPDVGDLVARGRARGRTLRRRRRAGTALGGLAAAAVLGAVILPAVSGTGDPDRAVDPEPAPADRSTPADPEVAAPVEPRELAMRAAGVPDVFASILPGDVAIIPGKENPMDGFDPRSQPIGGQTDHSDVPGEPGPGVMADFTWDGFYVRAAVAPTDPAFGATPLERCQTESGDGNGTCQALPGGAAVRSTSGTNAPLDGTTDVRSVTYYTADRWAVYLMVSNGATSRDQVLADEPPFTIAELTQAASSDAWFD